MTNCRISAGANLRLVVVGWIVATGLAACGSGSGTSGSGTAAVSPNVGVIARNNPPAGGSTATSPSTGTLVPPQGPQNPTGNPPSSPTSGTATLDWTPPTQNSDGTALTDLAGYYVYYGTSPDNLTESVKVSNPGLSAFSVGNLTSGTWYFAVTSFTSSGVESARTGVISTTI